MNRSRQMSSGMTAMVLIVAELLFSLSGVRRAQASEAEDARQLVDRATMTIEKFQAASDMDAFRDLLQRAKGVFIAPQVLKGAFIFGVSGGSGVLLAFDQDNKEWRGPAFYTIGELSWGLQMGGEASEVVLLAMTDRGVNAFLSNNFKLGADVAATMGPMGVGASAATANLSADIVGFSRAKGLFGGISINGALVASRPNLNHAYYGAEGDPADILIYHYQQKNPQADNLISAVAKAAGKQ